MLQPAELIIIGGAGLGTLLVADPLHGIKGIISSRTGVLGGSKFNEVRYLSTLKMMYQFLNRVRREGLLSVENNVEKPSEIAIFKSFPEFLKDHHALDFICDTLDMAITGGVEPFDMDQMMELDIEVSHRQTTQPVTALGSVADSLPGLGIVAALLGMVNTMGALGGPPEDIGHKAFESGSAPLSEKRREFLALLVSKLNTLPNHLLIDGHTDAAKYAQDTNYGNWELSADRANAARGLIQADGVRSNQVTQIRCSANQLLRVKNNPFEPSNRRVSILVKNF